ncbi:methyltransferase domain-containing protein [Persicitalea jodogahamensis]|nr:methyltransferase domain-containing protein [Persicitalea jodogahamensis]
MEANYWDNRYTRHETGWDLGTVSPPLKKYFDGLTDRSIRILIPGGGNSYEAEYLMRQGFTDVTVVDISAVLVERLSVKFSSYTENGLHLIHEDFFLHAGQYDLIVEQTFFCALDPVLRPEYVRQMNGLLVEGGKLVGVLFDRDFPGGPPYGGSRAEYQALLETEFEVLVLEPCYNSIQPRAGSEAFLIAQKKRR